MSPMPHKFLHGSVMDGTIRALHKSLIDTHGESAKFDVVYADPPWGPSLLKAFRTMNKGRHEHAEWFEFLAVMAQQVREAIRPDSMVFIDMSCKHTDDVAEAFAAQGLVERMRYEAGYKVGKTVNHHILWFGSVGDITARAPLAERMLHDRYDFVGQWAREVYGQGFTFMDPCMGLGLLASRVGRHGAEFYGAEVNIDRLTRGEKIVRAKCV